MPTAIESIKNNAKSIAATFGTLGVILGGGIAVDSRYVLAETYLKDQTSQVKAIEQLKKESNIRFDQFELRSIDDKIFFLEQQSKLGPKDKALLNRYQRQREDLTEAIKAQR